MASELRQRRRSQVAKAVVCKTIIHQFDSDRRLHAYNGLQAHACNPFFFVLLKIHINLQKGSSLSKTSPQHVEMSV